MITKEKIIILFVMIFFIAFAQISKAAIIPQGTWSLGFTDSEETVGQDGAAMNAFDGDPSTYWHTEWFQSNPVPPHEIQINLGGIYDISGFRYLPRQDGIKNGTISQYEFYVSFDGIDWGSPVAAGTFAANTTEKEVLFSTTTGQFIRLRALSEINGKPWTSAAEINVLGDVSTGNLAPDSIIDLPAGDVTIQEGETVDFSGHGMDPDNDLLLGYAWHFGNGSGIPDSSSQDPGTKQFNNPGVYTVTFAVTDSQGLSDPTPASRTVTVLNNSGGGGGVISQGTWSLGFTDSEETVGQDGAAMNAFDGDPSTYWHTEWFQSNPVPPHEIQINLGGIYDISGFRYLPRQDGIKNGTISQYEFYVSFDGIDWGSPVAAGTFAANTTEKEVLFSTTTGQFIRLRALSEINGKPWTSAAEINVLGDVSTGNLAPDSIIDLPAGDVTIQEGETVDFSGHGMDPDNDLLLGYAWHFGNGSGIPDSSSQDPGTKQFNNPGVYTVTFAVTDSQGLSDPTPASRTVTVLNNSGGGGGVISQGTWSLGFTDSEETVGQDGAAMNAFDGDPSTYWHTEWFQSNPVPPHEIQINLGGIYDISGFRYLPRQDGIKNGTISQYEFYVSFDGIDWGSPVAAGTFAANTTEKEVLFSTTTGQFIRLRALSEINGKPWTSAAEINVLGDVSTGNLAPGSIIDLPAGDVTIQEGETVDFSGHGMDPDNDLLLGYAWHFGNGSGIPDSSSQDPGTKQFNNPGVYTVTFAVTDSQGLSDPTPASRTVTVLNNSGGGGGVISQGTWSLGFTDSEETVGQDGAAMNAFDGDPSTYWHTEWFQSNPVPPHEIQINLGGIYDISGFRYLPRQDGIKNGTISQYEFYVSFDGIDWGSPVAAGTFAANTTEKEVLFSTTTGQFIRLRALSEINGKPWTSAAEITVLGECSAPSLRIIQPVEDSFQTSVDIKVVANVCLDENLNDGWGVKFILDGGVINGGQEYKDDSAPFMTTFLNVNKMEHTVKAIIIDNNENEIASFETEHQVNNVGVGDYYVAFGDSITEGFGDDISSDNISQDNRSTGPGYEPILADLLSNVIGYPHIVINEGIGGEESGDGAARIQSVIEAHPDAQYFLILFGTNDSSGSLPVQSGVGPGPPAPGTFKYNMQQIIDIINPVVTGKIPILAKVPIRFGDTGASAPYTNPETHPKNLLIEEYNTAIDELKSLNPMIKVMTGLPQQSDNFFTYFRDLPRVDGLPIEFYDNLHPNGSGYQSMADLWLETLTE